MASPASGKRRARAGSSTISEMVPSKSVATSKRCGGTAAKRSVINLAASSESIAQVLRRLLRWPGWARARKPLGSPLGHPRLQPHLWIYIADAAGRRGAAEPESQIASTNGGPVGGAGEATSWSHQE